ncbi:putative YL1 nuclear protein-domain-containing protein [Seiridium unicorne]|uniref:YL1 nuclear protein-domain-containing protein n=1 Tax=Seiridium unicorne TaxID=138068 RepID=A0ABR2V861_9PEZI
MAAEGAEQRMSLDREEEKNESVSSSESENSDDDGEVAPQVEWLATTRAKRSTAGNRMKSMLAAEEPDDELELLFAEDEDDAGFSDVDGGDSDVHMDSSSDDEDAQAQGDEDEGERELQKQARERKLAARKRKAQEAIPVKFRKKARVDPTVTDSSASTPAPRPKKKSERASWLPTPADMPTRASKRETTMLSKEALHQQMVEREAKRLKQVEAMERKAKRMEAMKKPPMTQAERLAEAAVIEKRNAKSLNRWEEAEKQREEERRAKLAALNNRQLSGPVVTFWSGMGEWVEGKLKHLGKRVTIEEKPLKKRLSVPGAGKISETVGQEEHAKNEPSQDTNASAAAVPATVTSDKPTNISEHQENGIRADPQKTETPNTATSPTHDVTMNTALSPSPPRSDSQPENSKQDAKAAVIAQPEPQAPVAPVEEPTAPDMKSSETEPSKAPPPESISLQSTPSNTKSVDMRPPDLQPPSNGPYTTSMFAPPAQAQGPVMKPPEMKPPSNSFLAPPPGATKSGLSMPVLGYAPPPGQPSNVLAAPNAAQRQSPLSMPQANARPPPPIPPAAARPTLPPQRANPVASGAHTGKPPQPLTQPPPKPLGTSKASHTNASKKAKEQQSIPDLPPSPRPPPPADMKATCNSIILQNFDENAIEQKSVQQRILFGKETGKLAKQAPPPKCIITNRPARYKDPKTGLPYFDSKAYKEIQKLQRGDYKWSRLVGAWVGTGSFAAQGVPDRFLDPNAPAPVKPAPPIKQEPAATPEQDRSAATSTLPPGSAGTAPVKDTQPVQSAFDPPTSSMPAVPAASVSASPVTAPVLVQATTPAVDAPMATTPATSISPGPSSAPAPSNIPANPTAAV